MGTQAKQQVTLLTDYAVDSAYSQAFYTLFANIRFNWDNEQTQHTVLLTAADRSEQATIVVNVAIAAALSGTPTILIDTDLQNSNLHQRFGAKNVSGLSNWLTQATHEETVTQFLYKTFVSDLHILSVGTSILQQHETNCLLSTKLQHIVASTCQFLAETEKRVCMIIFNSPPVLAGIGASLVSSLVEQTFLLITAGQTTQAQAKQAKEQLQRARAKVRGVIILGA